MATTPQTGRAVRLPLLLEPCDKGTGWTVTSPLVPELVTEGDTAEEVIEHVQDAWGTAVEFYEDDGRPLPHELFVDASSGAIRVEALLSVEQDGHNVADAPTPDLRERNASMTNTPETALAVRLPLLLEPQPEGGWTVTSPLVPGFVTEGDDFNDILANVWDAWPTLVELYAETGRTLPPQLFIDCVSAPIQIDVLIPA